MANELPKHLDWLRRQPCCECGRQPPSQPHHRPGGGKGRRSHDREAIPLCSKCHREFHALNGRFKGWSKIELQGWHDDRLAAVRAKISEEVWHDDGLPPLHAEYGRGYAQVGDDWEDIF